MVRWLMLVFPLLGLLSGCSDDEPPPTPTPPFVFPTATPTRDAEAMAEFWRQPSNELETERRPRVPFGPIAADPVRVRTGDGDCLNVRPTPGTAFPTDPRVCVPEGTLLWLAGPVREVDGFRWRFALGEGWVATEYTVPAPEATAAARSGSMFAALGSFDGVEDAYAVVDADGRVARPERVFAHRTRGIGSDEPGEIAPSGRWRVTFANDQSPPVAEIDSLVDRTRHRIEGVRWGSWGDGDRLAVVTGGDDCQCGPLQLAWIDAATGVVTPLMALPSNFGGFAWYPGGEALLVVSEYGGLTRYELDGRATPVRAPSPANPALGELSISPDGRFLLSNQVLGSVHVIDLATGATRELQRARQRSDFGGRCGGATGALSGWLDANTVFWHESYAAKGENGITLFDLRSGSRRIFPFFTVKDLRAAGSSGLLTFVTWESEAGQPPFPLTWLLDPRTGDARPVSAGDVPAWQ